MNRKFLKRIQNQSDLIEKRSNSEMSTGEGVINEYLKGIRVEFKREHFFADCINPKTGKLLFFDFYLPQYRVAIEYDGIQHYVAVDGRDKLDDLKARDKVKNKYCNGKGIYLLRVRNHMLKDLASFVDDAICRKGFKQKEQQPKNKQQKKPKRKVKPIKGQHPEKQMSRLKNKIELRNQELEKRRNEARLKYPVDVRIYIAEKHEQVI